MFKGFFRRKWNTLVSLLFISACSSSDSGSSVSNGATLSSGNILFAAHHTSDPTAPLKLWFIKSDGTGLTQLSYPIASGASDHGAPDIEKYAPGKWKVGYGTN